MPETIVACERVSAGYGQVVAIRDVSFDSRQGEVTAVIGPNGAGKTTLLDVVSGMLRARTGTVRWAGRDVTRWPAHRRARHGIVQLPEGRGILTRLTVAENMELGLDWRGKLSKRRGRALIEEQLDRFPILRTRYRLPAASLSGGEQQMLALARAILMRPSVLLLDEPSLGLAPIVVDQVFEELARIKGEGQTIVLVEQNAAKALELADRVYLLERGSIVMSGTAQEMLGNQRVREAYLPTDLTETEHVELRVERT